MPKLYIGDERIRKVYIGNDRIKKIYIGENLVFSDSHVVTYHINTNDIRQVEVDDGENALDSQWAPTATLSGFTFVGWRQDTQANPSVLPSKTVTEDNIHLYAVFSRVLTLTYNGNGATSGITPPSTGTQYYNNGNYNNPTITTRSNGYGKTNCRFDYWNIGSASGTAVAAGQPVTISHDMTAYAHWTVTMVVLVDSDYSTYNQNLWDIITGLSIPANMTAYITLTMNPSSGLANAKYSMNEWNGSSWENTRDFNGYNTMYPGQSATLLLYYKNNVRVRIQNMMVGTGYVTNDNIHVKIWGQL